jgi:hypothetical protein
VKKEQVKLNLACDLDAPFQVLLERFPETIKLYRNEHKDEVEYAFPDAEMFGAFLIWACEHADILPGDDASEELLDSLNYWCDQMGATPEDDLEVADNPNAPNLQAHEVAKQYVRDMGLPALQPTPYVKINPDTSKRIADAFAQAENSPDAEDVISAYEQFAAEVDEQFKYLPVQVISSSEFGEYPYKNSKELVEDVLHNNRMVVFDGGDDHAILTREQTFKFRAVHDYFGHVATGFEFGPRGEENAWIEHSKMFTPMARQALTTETRGQNSWVNFGPHVELPAGARPYAEQKAAILPPWVQTHEVLEEAYKATPEFYLGQARSLAKTTNNLVASVGRNPDDIDYTAFATSPTGLLFDPGEKRKAEPALTIEEFKKIRDEIYGRVMVYFEEGKDGMNWYDNTPKHIAEFFNNDRERTNLFIGFLAATSPLSNITQNVKNALKAMKQFDAGAWLAPEHVSITEKEYHEALQRGETNVKANKTNIGKKKVTEYSHIICPPTPDKFNYRDPSIMSKLTKRLGARPRMPEQRVQQMCGAQTCCFRLGLRSYEANAARVARGESLLGPKVSAFFNNLTKPVEQDNSVTVDTWMLRAFGFRKMDEKGGPTGAEYASIEQAVRDLAAMEGVYPRQFQAAVWVGIKRLHGNIDKDTDEAFETVLFREAEALARQNVFEFADDEAAEIMAMREQRNPPDEIAQTRSPDISLWNNHYGAWIAPDGKIYWVPFEEHADVASRLLFEKYGVDADPYTSEAYDEMYKRGYIRIYSNHMSAKRPIESYFGIELRDYEASKPVLKVALASLIKQAPSLRINVTEIKGAKLDFHKRKSFDEVASELFREKGGGWSEGVKKYHEWSSVGPMGFLRQGNNPLPASPSYDDWSAHYGAWLSPNGELTWVPYEGHVEIGRKILLENFNIETNEDQASPVYDAMFKQGYVRLITGEILRKDNEIGVDLASFAESKDVLEDALRRLRKENYTVEVLITEFPQSDDSEYKSWHKPLGALFQAKGGWSEGVRKYHEWSSVGPMGFLRQGNNPADEE